MAARGATRDVSFPLGGSRSANLREQAERKIPKIGLIPVARDTDQKLPERRKGEDHIHGYPIEGLKTFVRNHYPRLTLEEAVAYILEAQE